MADDTESKKQTSLLQKMSGMSEKQLAKQEKDKAALDEQKAVLTGIKKELESRGLDVKNNNKLLKEEAKLNKATLKLETQNKGFLKNLVGFLTPGSGADKEKQNEERRGAAKMLNVLSSIKSGIGSMASKAKEKTKAVAGGLFNMLKKGALMLAIPALIAFMQSPMFEDLKKWVVDEMIPALGRMVDAIKPVATAIISWVKDSFLPITIGMLVQSFKDLSAFFSDVFARFSGWSDMSLREKIGAVLGIFTNITELIGKLIGNMIEAVANLFGADGATLRKKYWDPIAKFFTDIVDAVLLIFTDPVAGIKKLFATLWDAAKGIGGFIFDIAIKPAWNWIQGLFGFGEKDKPKDADSTKGVIGFLTDLVVGVWEWFKGLFDFSTIGTTIASLINLITLPHQIIFGLVMGVWKWFKGLFGFETKDTETAGAQTKPGGLGGVLLSLVTGVWEWFKGLFSWGKVVLAKGADEVKGVVGFLTDLAVGVWEWFKGLFDFSSVGAGFASIINLITLPHQIIFGLVMGVWKWLKGLFGFSTEDTDAADQQTKPGGLGGILLDMVTGVWKWIKGLFGFTSEDTSGVKTGETKGLFRRILEAILPAGLLDFISSPITWLLAKVGITKNAETGELTDASGKVLTPAEAQAQATGIFTKVLKAILPDGLVDFIMSPWSWIKTKLGFGDTSTEKMDMVDPVTGEPIKVGKTDGIFASILKAILPDGLVDFLMNPIGWIMNSLGITKSKEVPKLPNASPEDEAAKMDRRKKMVSGILDMWPGAEWTRPDTIITKAANTILDLLGMQTGGLARAGQFAIVGENGPELVKFKRPAVVASNEQMRAGRDYAMNAMRAGATGPGAATNQAPILVNNITNAPVSNSTQANTKINTAIGSADPFTNVAVAY